MGDAVKQVHAGQQRGGFPGLVGPVDDVQVGRADRALAKIDDRVGEVAVASKSELSKAHRPREPVAAFRGFANTVKAHAQRLGLDPDRFAGHSLRAGFVTSADAQDASIFKIMDVTRHKFVDTAPPNYSKHTPARACFRREKRTYRR